MARIFQTGVETGSLGVFDVQQSAILDTGTTRGSWSGYSVRSNNSGGAEWTNKSSVAGGSDIYMGFGWRQNDGAGATCRLVRFKSATPAVQCTLYQAPTGYLAAYRGDGSTLLGTGTTFLPTGRWYYIEVRVRIDSSVGQFEVKIDGIQEFNLSGLNTKGDGAASDIARINIADSAGSNPYFDDIYVNDTTGSQNTGFSGDIKVAAYIPNAAGDVTGLTASAGSNYQCVDERGPNSDTDYVSDSGTSNYDLYNIPNTTAGTVSVQAVTLWINAKKTDAGAKNVAHIIKSGATENSGSDIALSTSYAYYSKLYNNDPTDSTAWTTSKLDSLQIGAKSR